MAAAGLPIALALGLLAEVASGLVRHPRSREALWAVAGIFSGTRRLVRGERASLLEAAGAGAALFGGGLVAASAIGAAPGSIVFVYLAAALAAAGGHVAASQPQTEVADRRVAGGRVWAALAEPAFAAALAVGFLRWRAGDLGVVWGAQEVLGTGFEVGPGLAGAGLGLGMASLVVAGALRLAPASETRRGPGRRAGSALLVTLCRWAAAGATAALVSALMVGEDLTAAWDADLGRWVGVAAGAAVVLGAAEGILARLGLRGRAIAVSLLWAVAGAGVYLVVAA